MSELKPCPFCGRPGRSTSRDGSSVRCGDLEFECAAARDAHDPKEWNSRPIEDALRERAEKAERLLTCGGVIEVSANNPALGEWIYLHEERTRKAEAERDRLLPLARFAALLLPGNDPILDHNKPNDMIHAMRDAGMTAPRDWRRYAPGVEETLAELRRKG